MSLKNQKTTTTYIEWSKAMSLLMKLDKDKEHKMMIYCAAGFFFGMRYSDQIQLKWNTVLYKDEFEIREKKTKKHRKIRICADMQKLIIKAYKSIAPESEDEFIFINKYNTSVMTIQYVNRKLKQIAKKYNTKELTSTHSLRKTFSRQVYELHQSDHALVILSDILSHSNLKTTKIYIGLKEEELLSVYDDLSMF